ncbi:MAG TPA: hypothetical protein EYP56_14880, partial [Planctomycetaceae bacterium]|nr:hypothetical protein [Planctomycetaceae bacterium]
MASGTAPAKPSKPEPPQAPPTRYEVVVDRRLRRTRRQIRGVDIATGLLSLTAVSLAYLWLAALADHWIVPGGLGRGGRYVLAIGFLALAGFCFWRFVLPVLRHPINPLFAAKVIEDSQPSLKNNLLNLLFLRREPGSLGKTALARHVLHGLARSTADQLQSLPEEGTVDQAKLIRWGYVLLAILILSALYLVLCPKSLLVSFNRVLAPWSEIPPPTRVRIDAIKPGDASALQGDTLTVSAVVEGLRDGESVLLYYTTADGQSIDQAVPMERHEGDYRYRCQLPPGLDGLQQDLTYYLAAGDCRSRLFHIQVAIPPIISVAAVHYDYLDYTGLADRVDRQTGDIQAVEGTRVTIQAVANVPIQQAWMEMNADARQLVPMEVADDQAVAKLVLRMKPDQPEEPQYRWYQVRLRDRQGRQNRRPTRHAIQVIPDRPPRISFVDPPPERILLPVDGARLFRLRAEDPDFALRQVVFRGEREGRPLSIPPLLDLPAPQAGHQGTFEATYRFEPARLGLRPGDEVIYWAEAQDNREDPKGPAPNQSQTPRRWIQIVAPEKDGGQPDKVAGAEKPDASRAAGQPEKGDAAAEAAEAEKQPDSAEKPPQTEQGQQGQPGQAQPDAEKAPDESQEDQRPADQQLGDQQDAQGGTAAASGEPSGGAQSQPQAHDAEGAAGQQAEDAAGQPGAAGPQQGPAGQQQEGRGQQREASDQPQQATGQQKPAGGQDPQASDQTGGAQPEMHKPQGAEGPQASGQPGQGQPAGPDSTAGQSQEPAPNRDAGAGGQQP